MAGLQSKFQNLNTKVNRMWATDGRTNRQTTDGHHQYILKTRIAVQSDQNQLNVWHIINMKYWSCNCHCFPTAYDKNVSRKEMSAKCNKRLLPKFLSSLRLKCMQFFAW